MNQSMTSRLLKAVTSNSLILKWIMVLLAGFCFLWSFQLFIAGNAYYSVKNDIEVWQLSPNKASMEKINSGLGKIRNAIDYFPDNALYYQIQGQLFEWKAVVEKRNKESGGVELDSQSSSAYLDNAAQSYEKSLLLRPKWSGSWIGLASVKLQQGELDEAFYYYLDNAKQVGPQDAILHKFIVEFGLEMFSARSIHYVKVKEQLKQHLDLGLQNPLSRDFVLKTIAKHNASETVCRWLRDATYPVRKRIPNCITYN